MHVVHVAAPVAIWALASTTSLSLHDTCRLHKAHTVLWHTPCRPPAFPCTAVQHGPSHTPCQDPCTGTLLPSSPSPFAPVAQRQSPGRLPPYCSLRAALHCSRHPGVPHASMHQGRGPMVRRCTPSFLFTPATKEDAYQVCHHVHHARDCVFCPGCHVGGFGAACQLVHTACSQTSATRAADHSCSQKQCDDSNTVATAATTNTPLRYVHQRVCNCLRMSTRYS